MRDRDTVFDLLERAARNHPRRRAFEATSYAALLERARLLASDLRRAHATGEPALIDGPAGTAWVIRFFAMLEAGLVPVPVLPGMDPDRVLAVARSAPLPAGTALVLVTAASERRPIAVPLTHGNLRADVRALLAARPAVPGETLLSVLPPSHLFELTAGLLAPVACGARVVFAPVPLPGRLLERMRAERVTRVMLVPALFELLMRAIPDRSVLPDGFERFVVGGAALDPRWREVCRRRGIGLDVGYGLTEAGPIVAVGDAIAMPAGACGRPLPGIEVRIGARREILVRGPNVTPGYLGEPPRGRGAWLRTGDFGRLDAAGHLFVDGRLKDAVVPDTGETIWPEDIEEHYRSPLIRECAVAIRRGRSGNDVPVLRVVPAVADRAAVDSELQRLRKAAPPRCRVKEIEIMNRPLTRDATGAPVRRAQPSARERALRRLIEDATGEDLSPFSADTDLMAELVIDSLAALRVLALVEHRFGVRFPDDRLGDFRSLRGLLDVIEAREKEASCASA